MDVDGEYDRVDNDRMFLHKLGAGHLSFFLFPARHSGRLSYFKECLLQPPLVSFQ